MYDPHGKTTCSHIVPWLHRGILKVYQVSRPCILFVYTIYTSCFIALADQLNSNNKFIVNNCETTIQEYYGPVNVLKI